MVTPFLSYFEKSDSNFWIFHVFFRILITKQGYALKNWVEGLSDEAYYPWESQKKNSTKIGQPYIFQWTKECFDLWKKANLQVFQSHRKQAKINIVFHHFPLLGLSKPPWFWIFQIIQLLPMKQLTEVKLTWCQLFHG